MKTLMDDVKVLNDGNPVSIDMKEGFAFTMSPSTAKKHRWYRTDKQVNLTVYEKKMPGVTVGQNRGMIFSSCRDINGDYIIPELREMNIIIVDEVKRKLFPTEDKDNKIFWKGNGEHSIKDVIADGQGQHWFCDKAGKLANDLWLKVAKFGYGVKGMLQPGLLSDIGCKVIDHWGTERIITKGNTLLLNSSLVKGLEAYNSLEELIDHAEMWGLTKLMKQWQSGDHKPENRRIMGTQPNSTNLQLTTEEITELLKPEARQIWAMKFIEVAWMKLANINTSRGRAIAARPDLMYNHLIMKQADNKAGNTFLRCSQGKFMAEGRYMKMYQDRLAYSLVYAHGMDPNEAAKKAAETGLHGEIRVSPNFVGRKIVEDPDGSAHVEYSKDVHFDKKGAYVEVALVRYPHGAPSETIVVKAYVDSTVPYDVIVFPAPVADKDGKVPVKYLYALRLQGADFDGDAVTAYTEKVWLEAQKRNIGKSYMIIPINTESTAKDTTLVTDETIEAFFEMKDASLSNKVGLIATSLKYFLSQFAKSLKLELNPGRDGKAIADRACAMGDDIDEFKHGKATNDLEPFVIPCEDRDVYLTGPYFNKIAKKYKSKEEFDKAVYDKNGNEKASGEGILDMYAVAMETLMKKAGLSVDPENSKASDGTDRFHFAVHPVKWESREVDLYTAEKGEGQKSVALPPQLEELYGVKEGTMFSAKTLFQMLYKDHSATCKNLLESVDFEEDRETLIKVANKINERYILAMTTIVAWTKKMKLVKDGEEIDTEDALKLFTTLLIQHTSKARSALDVMTHTGTITRSDGTKYERSAFSALRTLNYFLDVCGDGLFLLGKEDNDFPMVSPETLVAAEAEKPDMDEAKKKIDKNIKLIDKLVKMLPYGIEEVREGIANNDCDPSVLEDGSMWFGSDDICDC